MRIGCGMALVMFAVGCSDPGGIPIVRSDLGGVVKTPHFLTDLIVVAVSGQDLIRVEPQTGLADDVYFGVKTSWPLRSGLDTTLVHTTNGDLTRVALSGDTSFVLHSDDLEDFAGVRSDPYGKFILWVDPDGVLRAWDTTNDASPSYPYDSGDLKAVPRAVRDEATEALVEDTRDGKYFVVALAGGAPTAVQLPEGFVPFGEAFGVNGVRIAGTDENNQRVMVADESGALLIDMPVHGTWGGRAAIDVDGSSVVSLEEVECFNRTGDVCDDARMALVRYRTGQDDPEVLGDQTVVALSDLLALPPELSLDGTRLMFQSKTGLWFVGNPGT